MGRGRIIMAVAGGMLVVVIGFIVVASWSFTKLMRNGDVNTLDSLNFDNQFSSAKKPANSSTPASTTVNAESMTAPSLGSDKAPLRVVEFVDFACPYSKQESTVLRELSVSNPDKVWLQVRNFPTLDGGALLHPGAEVAAEAAMCANEQGKYWNMYDALFANQNSDGTFSADDLRRMAIAVGVDAKKYDVCIGSGRTKAGISADYQAGLAIAVTGTPTFFVNGDKIDGAIPGDAWQTILKLVK